MRARGGIEHGQDHDRRHAALRHRDCFVRRKPSRRTRIWRTSHARALNSVRIDISSSEGRKRITMRYAFILALALPFVVSCGEFVDKSAAIKAAEGAGFTDVRVTAQHGMAPSFYGCSKDDSVAFEIVGKNPIGKQTTATVCCGLFFKSCTVRY
jgi:hypothetical protein